MSKPTFLSYKLTFLSLKLTFLSCKSKPRYLTEREGGAGSGAVPLLGAGYDEGQLVVACEVILPLDAPYIYTGASRYIIAPPFL
jgi:hypothetical protein